MVVTTDPEGGSYKYGPGLRKMEQEYEPGLEDAALVTGVSDEIRSKILNDPVFRLQHQVEDKSKADSANERFDALVDIRDTHFHDDFDRNARLRSIHRQKKQEMKQALKEGQKRGLSIPLAEESSHDAVQAKEVNFKQSGFKRREKNKFAAIASSSIFSSTENAFLKKKKKVKEGSEAQKLMNQRCSLEKIYLVPKSVFDIKTLETQSKASEITNDLVHIVNTKKNTQKNTQKKTNNVTEMFAQYDSDN
jgi:hypothetical protein